VNIYATLDDLRDVLRLDEEQTSDDGLLLALLDAASRLIEGFAGRQFYPQRASRRYTVTDPQRLCLGADLLELHSLTNGDGSLIPAAAIHLEPAGLAVRSSLVLDRTQAAFTHNGDPVDALVVDGMWGYHPDWATAWRASGDTVQNDPLDVADTALLVSDADAPWPTGFGRRFAAGHLIRIGDESLHVLAVDAGANTLTVARGVNGTTATTHTLGATIDVYQPPADVRQACLRVATWLYKQPDAGFVQRAAGLRGQVIVPPALPEDVQQILAPYVRVRVA